MKIVKTGMQVIIAERCRQIEVEGWTPEHDDSHGADVLESAAIGYRDAMGDNSPEPDQWPWDASWWKPKSRARNLARAGALYLAAADVAERSKDYDARDRLKEQAQTCAVLLESIR